MTQPQKPDDASVSEEIETLKAEILKFSADKDTLEQDIRTLLQDENPALGVFHHQEIFSSQQEKLRLDAEIDIRRRKINRLRLGGDWTGGAGETAQRN